MIPVQVGILGGGQLAQMLCLAAHGMGIKPFVLGTKTSDCAHHVTQDFYIDNGSDDEIRKFFSLVDVVTIENEFIDLERFQRILGDEFKQKLLPRVETLKLVQSKLDQKNFLLKNKINTLEFFEVQSIYDLDHAYEKFGGQVVFKKARLGYDGRGTYIFDGKKDKSKFQDFKSSFSQNLKDFGYAERLAPFEKEVAVLITRSTRGQIESFPLIETFQSAGICRWAFSPSGATKKVIRSAEQMAEKVLTRLRAVGTFAIEMFVLTGGEVVINEIAPRVHNSGHLTQNGATYSQFEQHLRAILGWPLGQGRLTQASAMVNIIGQSNTQIYGASQIPCQKLEKGTWIHWYGKSGDSFGRKIGHVNAVGATAQEALKTAKRQRLKVLI